MKVQVNKKTCISCGICVELCPDIFEWDENDVAQAKQEEVPIASECCAQDAAEQCPVDAITVEK